MSDYNGLEESDYNPFEDDKQDQFLNIKNTIPDAYQDKSLFEGFKEQLSRIQSDLNKSHTSDSTCNASQSTLVSPNTETSDQSTAVNSLQVSPNTQDQFSPNTLKELNNEIEINASNLANLDEICKEKDSLTKASINERLLEERKDLLDQKSKHLNSVVSEAKRLPMNDTDMNGLCKEISELKANVDKLVIKTNNLKYRSLSQSDASQSKEN